MNTMMDLKVSPGFEDDRITPIYAPVRTIACQVFKMLDGQWSCTLAIGHGVSAFMRDAAERPTRTSAIETIRGWLQSHFNRVPAGVSLRIGRATTIAFPVSSARPWSQ